MEAEEVQEQIVGEALKNVVMRKGDKLRLKEMGAGGMAGKGKMITVGMDMEETPLLSAEICSDIKKTLVLSKNKMEKLCHIMRKNRVKMEPNVRQKLKEIDHLLDEEYETVKVKFQVNESGEEVEKESKDKNTKTKNTGGKVNIEQDVTILKNTKNFVEKLVVERGIWGPDAITRISIDGDINSIKVIPNVFSQHQDPEITFTNTETAGNLCSGVKRSIIVCYVEKLEESYANMQTLMEMMNLQELPFVIASDFKLINVMLGLCGHGGKYACCYCEAEKS